MYEGERSYLVSLYLRIWAVMFGAMGCAAAFLTGFSIYVLYAAIISLILAIPLFIIIHWFGESAVNMFLGLGSKIGVRQQLAGELDKARHSLRTGKYQEAYETILPVLEAEPEFDDALLIRAEIEMRTGRSLDAQETLKTLLKTAEPGFKQRRWALSMLARLRKRQGDQKSSD